MEQQHAGDAQGALVAADSAVIAKAIEMMGFDALAGTEGEGLDELDGALVQRGAAGEVGHGVQALEQDLVDRVDGVVDLVLGEEPFLVNEVALEVLAEQNLAFEACGIPRLPSVFLHQTLSQQLLQLVQIQLEIRLQNRVVPSAQIRLRNRIHIDLPANPQHVQQNAVPPLQIAGLAIRFRQHLDGQVTNLDYTDVARELDAVPNAREVLVVIPIIEIVQPLQLRLLELLAPGILAKGQPFVFKNAELTGHASSEDLLEVPDVRAGEAVHLSLLQLIHQQLVVVVPLCKAHLFVVHDLHERRA